MIAETRLKAMTTMSEKLLYQLTLTHMQKYTLNVCAQNLKTSSCLYFNTDLLAPLTSASDLPNHPTLSKPFTSKALTELTKHAGEMLQKEKASLWRIKHLLTRLSGDNTWIPCESVETQHDFDLFLDDRDRLHVKLPEKIIVEDGDQVSTGTLLSEESHVRSLALEDSSKVPDLNRTRQISTTAAKNDDLDTSSSNTPQDLPSGGSKGVSETLDRAQLYELKKAQSAKGNTHIALEVDHDESGDVDVAAIIPSRNEDEPQPLLEEVESADTEDSPEDAGEPAPRRMRTRAQAQAASENTASSRARSLSPDFNEDIFVSQFFLAPRSSHPDRDLGLPQHEADDIRRLLQLYIQKQEEVCRGVQKVYDGLMKADRYRNQVMKWAKAEGHVGVNRDMSDGEDWYDKEEWGLDEDLKKGQDEEEEDAATTAKKTRTRRQ
jgi:hypothetical protein